MHRSLGDLEALGQGSTGHPAMGLQQQQRGQQSIGFQRLTSSFSFSFFNYDIPCHEWFFTLHSVSQNRFGGETHGTQGIFPEATGAGDHAEPQSD
jgi:hypothetical protein